jgi:hypothetical protein
MIVVCVIQAVLLAVLVFIWQRQRAQLAWVDERDVFLGSIMTAMQQAIVVNAPAHSKGEIDGVYVGGTLIPSRVGMQQLWVVYDQLQEAWGASRTAVNAMAQDYGRLKRWELTHPVPGPKWIAWPYVVQRPQEQVLVEVEK